jgi:SAM-dependent methyltransferase
VKLRHTRPARLARKWLSAVLPDRPTRGDRLDAEYAAGSWDYLRGIGELARFSVVAGYCHFLKPGGSILEIGCGEGILNERLDPGRYGHYLGIDVSAEAIARARPREGKATFLCADATTWETGARFDLIVFNECLEYFDDPLALVRRYESFLAPGGLFLVSMFVGVDTVRARRIWRRLESTYRVKDETRVTNQAGYSWTVKVLRP